MSRCEVGTAAELVSAIDDPVVSVIIVSGEIEGLSALHLRPGQKLAAEKPGAVLSFVPGQDGVRLSTDNELTGLGLLTDPDRQAVFNDVEVDGLGRLVLSRLDIQGVVRILAAGRIGSGHVEARDIDIVSADARAYDERPQGYGVEVVPGVFTLWNRQADRRCVITAELTGISLGRAGAPARGSGVFVGGAGDVGGRVVASRIETGEVHIDGGIAPGTPDRISGGVFVVHGAFVDAVRNVEPVTTYGPNDMVLDNWGTVDTWIARGKITSHGPSGIGLVNFGTIRRFEAAAPIETFGQGARGFNVYAGTIDAAVFERIVTHADGAVGIQISRPVGEIVVRRGLETFGGRGKSLVKGVVVELSAVALSIKPGGSCRRIEVSGGLAAHGDGSEALELHGAVGELSLSGGVSSGGGQGA